MVIYSYFIIKEICFQVTADCLRIYLYRDIKPKMQYSDARKNGAFITVVKQVKMW